MKSLGFLVVVMLPMFLAVGCSDDTATDPGHNDEFEFELTVSPDHVSTLKEITFTLEAHAHDGGHADFEALQLERRLMESETWRAIEMTHGEDEKYHGTYTFVSSGEHEFRVMGMTHEGHMMEELHHFDQAIHVERAHMDAGGYEVAYESFPGHVHEGDAPELSFWVSREDDGDPVTGMSAEGRCTENGGMVHLFTLSEGVAGVYSAVHTVEAAGTTRIAILFEGEDGSPAVAEFTIETAHKHGD